jgi:hypothetical protein
VRLDIAHSHQLRLVREQVRVATGCVASEFACQSEQAAMNSEAKSREECLTEAAECERLAGLSRSESARKVMTLSASVGRKRAEQAARARTLN